MIKIGKKLNVFWKLGIVLFVFAVFKTISAVYASEENLIPTIEIKSETRGSIGSIFKNDQTWYPGHSESASLRVLNSYGSKIYINKIGMNIALTKGIAPLAVSDVNAHEYLTQMKIKVEYNNSIKNFLNGTIFNGTFEELIKGKSVSIPLENKDFVDLVYTVTFKNDAEGAASDIVGKVGFTVDVAEEVSAYSGGGSYTPPAAEKEAVNKDDEAKNDDEDAGKVLPEIENHWARNSIIELLKAGIITGYPDGKMKPDEYITRAEAAVLVGKSLKLKPKDKFFSGYLDRQPEWAKGYIIATSEKGIFRGYSGKLFKPNKNISREEMTTVLVRAFNKKPKSKEALKFKDKDQVSDWAAYYVNAGVQNNIIEGYPDNTFKPKSNITRAEVFVILSKLVGGK